MDRGGFHFFASIAEDLPSEDRWHRFTPVPLAIGGRIRVTANGKVCCGTIAKCTAGAQECGGQLRGIRL